MFHFQCSSWSELKTNRKQVICILIQQNSGHFVKENLKINKCMITTIMDNTLKTVWLIFLLFFCYHLDVKSGTNEHHLLMFARRIKYTWGTLIYNLITFYLSRTDSLKPVTHTQLHKCTTAAHQPQNEQHESRWMALSAKLLLLWAQNRENNTTFTYQKNLVKYLNSLWF